MHLPHYDNILPEIMLGFDPSEDDETKMKHEVDEDELMEYEDWRDISE